MSDHPIKIVSSSHLVSERAGELSEFEFGLTVLNNAFNRWMVRCMSAAGEKEMTSLEVQLIHHVTHRKTAKKLADICFVLNIEDTHIASYALKNWSKWAIWPAKKSARKSIFLPPKAAQPCVNAIGK